MEQKNITMSDMILKIIQENQLSCAEEDMVWEIMEKRRRERIKNKSCRCLADYAEREREMLLADDAVKMKDKAERLHRRFLRETRVGSMDVDKISDTEIRRLILSAAESGDMAKGDWLRFLAMIQLAVNAAGAAGVHGLESSVFKNVFHDCKRAEAKIRYGKNPYTSGEVQKITGWLDRNTDDIRALAVDMWLSGGITPKEIVGLRTNWLVDIDGSCTGNPSVIKKNETEDYLLLTDRRSRIIQDALKIQDGAGNEYIFMVSDDGEWKKCLKNACS